MIKILSLDLLGVSLTIPWKNKNAVYYLQISALVPEIFVFKKKPLVLGRSGTQYVAMVKKNCSVCIVEDIQ